MSVGTWNHGRALFLGIQPGSRRRIDLDECGGSGLDRGVVFGVQVQVTIEARRNRKVG